ERIRRPLELEVVDRAAVPVFGVVPPLRVVAGVATAGGAVAPDQLHAAVGVGALFEVHLVGMVAERPEVAEGAGVTHREPLHVLLDALSLLLAKVRDVEFHLAVGAGGNVVVDAVGEAERLPALALDEPAPALDADRAAVGQRIEDVLAVLEAAVPGSEGLD